MMYCTAEYNGCWFLEKTGPSSESFTKEISLYYGVMRLWGKVVNWEVLSREMTVLFTFPPPHSFAEVILKGEEQKEHVT